MGPPGQPWSRPLVTFLGVPPFLALIETVTIAVHLQNMNVVGEAVEQCGEDVLYVQVLELDPKEVRLLFRAPPQIKVDRLERYKAKSSAEEIDP